MASDKSLSNMAGSAMDFFSNSTLSWVGDTCSIKPYSVVAVLSKNGLSLRLTLQAVSVVSLQSLPTLSGTYLVNSQVLLCRSQGQCSGLLAFSHVFSFSSFYVISVFPVGLVLIVSIFLSLCCYFLGVNPDHAETVICYWIQPHSVFAALCKFLMSFVSSQFL